MRRIAFAVLIALSACGSNTCPTNEIELVYSGGASNGKVECKPVPEICAGQPVCEGRQTCTTAIEDLCASPYASSNCDDNLPPLVVTCTQ